MDIVIPQSHPIKHLEQKLPHVPLQEERTKRDLYIKIFKQEFIRELQYLWDVANDRATARSTFTEKLVEKLKVLPKEIPVIGKAIDKLGEVAKFAANEVRDKQTEFTASLYDQLDIERLEILLDVVAREAYRRYEYFIERLLGDNPEKCIIPFAKVGVARSLEYLTRKTAAVSLGSWLSDKKQTVFGAEQKKADDKRDEKIKLHDEVKFNQSSLLTGLIEGRSGSFVQGWTNHKVLLKRKKTGSDKPKEIDAEEAYARSAMMHFEINRNEIIKNYYVRKEAWHKNRPWTVDVDNFLRGETEALYDFGRTAFRGKEPYKKDPRCGFAIMPLSAITNRYEFKETNDFSPDLKKELEFHFSLSVVKIDKTTLKNFADWYRKHPAPLHTIAYYLKEGKAKTGKDSICRNAKFVSCHEDLTGINLQGINLSSLDLSGATISGDLTDTQFNGSYLIGTKFINVTSAKNANFHRAHCAFLQAEGIDFSGTNLTQTNFSFANLTNATLTRCITLGAIWHQTKLDGIKLAEGVADLHNEQKRQHEEWQAEQAVWRAEFKAQAETQSEQLARLMQLQKQMEERLQNAIQDNTQGVEEKLEHVFKQELQKLDKTHQQEFERLYREISTSYTDTNKRIDALASELPRACQERMDKVASDMQQQLEVFKKELNSVVTERLQLREMQEKLQNLIAEQEARHAFEEYCRKDLQQLQKAVAQAADKQTVAELQKQLSETQTQIKELQTKNQTTAQQFTDAYAKQIAELGEQHKALKAELTALQDKIQKELQIITKKVEERLKTLEEQWQQTHEQLSKRLDKLEKRIDSLEDLIRQKITELQSKLQASATKDEVVALQQRLKLVEDRINADQAKMDKQVVEDLQKQYKELNEQSNKKYKEIIERVSALERWADKVNAQLAESKESNETVKTLRTELNKLVEKQQAREAEEKRYRAEIEALQNKLQTTASGDDVIKLKKQLNDVNERLQTVMTDQIAREKAVQKQLEVLTAQQTEFNSWQKEFTECTTKQAEQNKQRFDQLQQQQKQLETLFDSRLKALEKEITDLKLAMQKGDAKIQDAEKNLQKIVRHQEFTDQKFTQQDKKLEELEKAQHKQELGEKERNDLLMQKLVSLQRQVFDARTTTKSVKPPINPQLVISYFDLDFDSKLPVGQGTFAEIYLGQWQHQRVVIKKPQGRTKEDLNELIREVNIMERLRHRNVVQIYGASVEKDHPCLIMEHMELGSLKDLLATKIELNPEQQINIALDIANGLAHIHTLGVIHRDLKSGNILINKYFQAKLADFGIAKANTDSISPTHKSTQAMSYLPPEAFNHLEHTKQSDIYCFGVLLWEIMTGKIPLENCDDIKTQVMKGENREPIPDTVPEVCKKIIRDCWQVDSSRRPSLNQIIAQLNNYKEALLSFDQGIHAEKAAEKCEDEKQPEEAAKHQRAAYAHYQESLKKGNLKAQANLGIFFSKGIGGAPKDPQKALECFTSMAERGHARSMFNAAYLLQYGKTSEKDKEQKVETNIPKALAWYEKAANAGDITAMVQAGRILRNGDKDIKADTQRALTWFEKAAATEAPKDITKNEIKKHEETRKYAQQQCERLRPKPPAGVAVTVKINPPIAKR